MIVGFNHNVSYKGVGFHVQTEDSGVKSPQLVTLLYHGGTIISSKKTVYEDILNIDTNCTEALLHLGKIKELDFYEYNNSVLKVGSDPALSFDEFAIEDYLQAERFFRRAIKKNSTFTVRYCNCSY